MGVQNKPLVASSRVKDNESCGNSRFSSLCQDSLFTRLRTAEGAMTAIPVADDTFAQFDKHFKAILQGDSFVKFRLQCRM